MNIKIIDRAYVFEVVGKQAKVIVEIGACDGDDTVRMLNAFPDARIYSIEPKPENILLWKEKMKTKGHRTILWEGAISDVNDVGGGVDLYCSNDKYMGASSIRQPTKLLIDRFKGLVFTHKLKVSSITLDGMCKVIKIKEIDLLWIDTQGAEGDVIKGGQETLKHTKYLFIEYALVEHYKGQVLVKEMIDMLPNFELVGKFQENLFMRNKELK